MLLDSLDYEILGLPTVGGNIGDLFGKPNIVRESLADYDYAKAKWKKWQKETKESFGFYDGSGQWNKQLRTFLESRKACYYDQSNFRDSEFSNRALLDQPI